MGKKAREKRERRYEPSPASGASPAPQRSATTPAPARAPSRLAASATPFAWPEWPRERETLGWPTLAAVFALALIVRVVLLSQMTRTPYLEIDTIDARAYQTWAEQILGGDWLPLRHFYQSPLYAYYLAAVYAVFGRSPWPPRVVQILLGSASAALLALVGAKVFNRRVGIIAGVLLAMYGPMILEEISLAKTVLIVFGGLVAFACYLEALERRGERLMAVAGAVFGVTVIGVGQWLLALVGLTIYAAVDRTLPRPTRRRLAGVFLTSALVMLVPIVAWNSYFGGGLMLTSGDAGLNLYLGNNPRTTGLTGRPPGLRDVPEFEEGDSHRLAERDAGRPLTPAGVSRHWSQRAMAWALAHPFSFLETTRKKLLVLWNSYEIPDSYHFAFIRAQYLPWLWGGGSFAVVGPLGLVGLVLAARHRRAWPLYVMCLGYLGVIALFYVRSRYRMPAVPFLIVFAAAAVDWAIRVFPREDWRPLAALGLGAAVATVVVNHTYCEPATATAPAICLGGDVWFDLEWQKIAEWYERRGDPATALDYLHRAAAGESLRGPGQLQLWMGRLELTAAQRARAARDDTDATAHLAAAAAAFDAAVRHGYHVHEAQTYLADAYLQQGDGEHAVAASDAAVRARPKDPTVLLAALRVRATLGRCDDARRYREDLRRLRPDDAEADQILARCGTASGGS